MKTILSSLVLALMAIGTHAQTCKIKIYYDENGNRIQRALECQRPAPPTDTPLVQQEQALAATGLSTAANASFQVYPNPSETQINVRLDAPLLNEGCSILLTDIAGKTLAQKQQVKELLSSFSLEGYADGTYFVIVVSGSRKHTVKIVKQTGNGFR
ncbi:T9SS type A sorting domain-containing protein [Taibaiella helva]|uniref:T9SS type A sorting domain-containing protein n=1 Tax=Taibaiella helva TaxID=2301235 RepID=UPI001300A902|nr:T9SS type A sorting domain-containing protein [Taibaiella helva]